jgi:hypothetical protein
MWNGGIWNKCDGLKSLKPCFFTCLLRHTGRSYSRPASQPSSFDNSRKVKSIASIKSCKLLQKVRKFKRIELRTQKPERYY